MIGVQALPLAVAGAAAVSLALLGTADHLGWMQHGAKPAQLGVAEWAVMFVAGWTLMTGAMMLPSTVPFLRAVQRIGRERATVVAAAGYVAAWAGAGVMVLLALWAAGSTLADLPATTLNRFAGVTLVATGVYQLSGLSRACQRACARPFGILARRWRRAEHWASNALAAGVHYGISCVGCCVYMIVLMLVVGMSNLVWMLALAATMIVQKDPAWGPRMTIPIALTAGILGVAVIAGWWTPELHGFRHACGE